MGGAWEELQAELSTWRPQLLCGGRGWAGGGSWAPLSAPLPRLGKADGPRPSQVPWVASPEPASQALSSGGNEQARSSCPQQAAPRSPTSPQRHAQEEQTNVSLYIKRSMKNLFINFSRWATSLYRTLRTCCSLHPVRRDHTRTHARLPRKPRKS